MRTLARARIALLLAPLLAGGCGSSHGWTQIIDEVPWDADEVIAAVQALPECGGLGAGGQIVWRPVVFCGRVTPVSGCSYPSAKPRRIEIAYRASAWDGNSSVSTVSTLAHELCHMCGYTDGPDAEAQADACALRARAMAGK